MNYIINIILCLILLFLIMFYINTKLLKKNIEDYRNI